MGHYDEFANHSLCNFFKNLLNNVKCVHYARMNAYIRNYMLMGKTEVMGRKPVSVPHSDVTF
jgi:hypothetical protein